MLLKEERIQVSQNFYLDEFLNPQTYGNIIGDRYKSWQALIKENPAKFWNTIYKGKELKKLVNIAQFVRNRFGKSVTCNNWATGGDRINSGFREQNCKIGAPLSAHKTMNGEDLVVDGVHENDIYADVLSHQKEYMEVGVTEIEQGTWSKETGEGWSHLGTRKTGLDYIKVIPYWNKPKK